MEQNKTVLYVDDNDDHLELAKLLFEMESYEFIGCRTHLECFDHIKTTEFAAIILDSWLSEKNGFEICAEIRELKPDVPIIFFSADVTVKSRQRGLKAGANAYLIKPDDLEKLTSIVTTLISEYRV